VECGPKWLISVQFGHRCPNGFSGCRPALFAVLPRRLANARRPRVAIDRPARLPGHRLVNLLRHGAFWVAMKSDGTLQQRVRNIASFSWFAVVFLSFILVLIVPLIRPHFASRYAARPWCLVFPILAFAGLMRIRIVTRAGRDAVAFICSCAYILTMLASAAFGHYPYLLPAISEGQAGQTIFNASTSGSGLSIRLYWFIPGVTLAPALRIRKTARFLPGPVPVSIEVSDSCRIGKSLNLVSTRL
jgi:hypothetical protein